jgi:hypothetical protein
MGRRAKNQKKNKSSRRTKTKESGESTSLPSVLVPNPETDLPDQIRQRDGSDIITGLDISRPYEAQAPRIGGSYFLVATWNWINKDSIEWRIEDDQIARYSGHDIGYNYGRMIPEKNDLTTLSDDYFWDGTTGQWRFRKNDQSAKYDFLYVWSSSTPWGETQDFIYGPNTIPPEATERNSAFTTSSVDYLATQSTKDMKAVFISDGANSGAYFLDRNGTVVAKWTYDFQIPTAVFGEHSTGDVAKKHPDYSPFPLSPPFPLRYWNIAWGISMEETAAANNSWQQKNLGAISKYYDSNLNPLFYNPTLFT